MRAAGIDLGTRSARVAIIEGGAPKLVELQGGPELPSVISYSGRTPMFGHPALARAVTHTDSTVHAVKLLLGRARNHPSVEAISSRASFAINVSGARMVLGIGGAIRPPEAIAASLLDHLMQCTVEQAGSRPDRAVLAVPAWFGEPERKALSDAAARASIEAPELILDPTALVVSALPSLLEGGALRLVAAVDLGAGGMSAGLYAVTPAAVQLVHAAGDELAGGDAIDQRLIELAFADLERAGPIQRDPATNAMLRASIESMKRTLASGSAASVPIDLDVSRFESAIAGVLAAAERCLTRLLESAKLDAKELDTVLLAGGSAEVPQLRARVEHVLGTRAKIERVPRGAVALGAARIAAGKTGELPAISISETPAPAPSKPAAAPAPMPVPPVVVHTPPPPAITASLRATIPPTLTPVPRTPTADLPRPPISRASTPTDFARFDVTKTGEFKTGEFKTGEFKTGDLGKTTDDLGYANASQTTGDLQMAAAVPSSGRIVNPTTARGLLELAMTRRLEPRDLEPIALPVLLFTILGRQKKSGMLTVTAGDKSTLIPIVRGAPLLRKAEHGGALGAFRWPAARFSFDAGAAVDPASRTRYSMLRLTIEGLRLIARGVSEDELRDALADRLELAPQVPADLASDLERMGLMPNEVRIAKHSFDGATALRELLAQGGAGRHTTLQLVLILVLFNYLDWVTVAAARKRTLADELAARAAQVSQAANHFEVLGVHWSATSGDVELAFRKIVSELGPGTTAQRIAPEPCEKIMARVETAYGVLRDDRLRTSYRREMFPDVDFSAVSDILSGTLDTMEMRGDHRGVESTKGTMREMERTTTARHIPAGEGSGATRPAKKP